MDHNPHLAVVPRSGDDKGSEAGIERPDRVVNIAWQTRAAPPGAAENALADALQAIFAEEIYELPRIVERLNRLGVAPPAGAAAWSEESFQAELHRLGR
ncbi:MAG TPA: recombinase-like helix-turn-helix domain-containing protein [Stellaceae bacterium]|nr:recombinase-like helix-turn-helix domain-containing protein [Stellaceae bacterium]